MIDPATDGHVVFSLSPRERAGMRVKEPSKRFKVCSSQDPLRKILNYELPITNYQFSSLQRSVLSPEDGVLNSMGIRIAANVPRFAAQ
jgi:hypothetical protein